MAYRIENISTETWHRIIDELKAEGFAETYRYGGMDAGIDYNKYELTSLDGDEVVVCEWDNWTEGEIEAAPSRLAALREKYRLAEPVEVGE